MLYLFFGWFIVCMRRVSVGKKDSYLILSIKKEERQFSSIKSFILKSAFLLNHPGINALLHEFIHDPTM